MSRAVAVDGLRAGWRLRSLRFRVLAGTSAVTVVALLLALAAYAATLQIVLQNAATSAASDQARQVAAVLTQSDSGPGAALRDIPSGGSILQLLNGNLVVSANDFAAASRPLAPLRPEPGRLNTVRMDALPGGEQDPYVVAALGLPPTVGASTLLVATPLQSEASIVPRATLLLGAFALFLAAVLLCLIHRVLGNALGRVERVRASVDRVTGARSMELIAVPPGGDEITHLAETMNDMLRRLLGASAAQRAFVSDASHELRSPLTAIRTITEGNPLGIDERGVTVVAAEARRMQRLVEDLLTLARSDDPDPALARRPVDLEDLLLEEAYRLRVSAGPSVVEERSAALVLGDSAQLSQLVRNLVDNAVRHAAASVRLSCRSEIDGTVVVNVDNDGDPVPVSRRSFVFERFARLQDARDRDSGGSGLGLAVVRAVAEAHGGSVTALEAPDGWCRFQVRLPGTSSPPDSFRDSQER